MRHAGNQRQTVTTVGALLIVAVLGLALPLSLPAFGATAAVAGDPIRVPGDPGWTPVPGLANSMTLVLTVERNGVPMADPLDKVAVIVGSEIRGVASPTNLGGTWVFFLAARSNGEGDALSFQFYDASTDEVVAMCEGMVFQTDAKRGSVGKPYMLHENSAVAPACALYWDVAVGYPSSMSIYASVHFSGNRSSDPGDRVVALVGNEIRGVGTPFDAGGEQVFAIETWGDVNGEQLRFQLYRQSTGYSVDALQATTYLAGYALGSPGTPFRLDADAALPIEFVSLRVVTAGSGAVVSWEVGSESGGANGHVVGYRLERKSGGAEDVDEGWVTVGDVAPGAGPRYTARVEDMEVGHHSLRVAAIFYDGEVSYSRVLRVGIVSSRRLDLSVPYPNPARTRSNVVLTQSVERHVSISLNDLVGRRVLTLFEGVVPADTPVVLAIDAGDLARGRYVVVARGDDVVRSRTLFVVN